MIKRVSMVLFVCLGLQNFVSAQSLEGQSNEAMVRLVADGILKNTTRCLVNRITNEKFQESEALTPAPEISIESKFNAWFYQTWLLTDGMRRVSAALQEERYKNYGEKNLEFIYHHLPYFQKQHDLHIIAAPVGDGKLSPIGLHFQISALWHSGLAPLVMERYAETKDPKYQPYLDRFEAFLAKAPRLEDGTLFRPRKGMMTDDPYMTVPYFLRRWKSMGDVRALDAAIQQVLGTYTRSFEAEQGLYKHLYDIETKMPGAAFWGRGNGWMALAHTELLAWLPKDHPRYGEVLNAFVKQAEGLRRWQDPAGGWHQVIDHPETWIETSCTGMFVYLLARGVNEGWLDRSFAKDAENGWKALRGKVTADGDITDVCGSTDTGDVAFYSKRPRLTGDLHGFGSFLLGGGEILRMEMQGNR